MGNHLERGILLFQQSRYELAEKELLLALASNPDEYRAHSLLGQCLAERERYAEAEEEARKAVAIAPDDPYPHYALGIVLRERGELRRAAESAHEAIRLDPEDADYRQLLAGTLIKEGRWDEANRAAEQGLALDAEHVGLKNLRAFAQRMLGHDEEAGKTLDSALEKAPENAVTHANVGWKHLSSGEREKAMEHFREALRLDPSSEWAREGLVEALKARNFIYAAMLRYFVWTSKLSRGAQWGLIILIYMTHRVLRSVARSNPQLEPYILPILFAIGAFVILTWIASPVFNLLLRLDPVGKHALSKDQRVAANLVGLSLVAAALTAVYSLVVRTPEVLLPAALFGLLTMPISATFMCDPGWPRLTMGGLSIALAACAALSFALIALGGPDEGMMFKAAVVLGGCTFLGIFLSGWAGNYLAGVTVKK